MCGIVGYVGRQDALRFCSPGCSRLEYRGYDSAGVAVCTRTGLKVHKAEGRVADLDADLPARLKGTVGIAHTRWATHGEPNDVNAHPHVDCSGRHRRRAQRHHRERRRRCAPSSRRRGTCSRSRDRHRGAGAPDRGVRRRARPGGAAGADGRSRAPTASPSIDARQPDRIVAARNGSPVVIGIGDKEMFVASDVAALVRYTEQVVYLDDREVAVVEAGGYRTARSTTGRPARARRPCSGAHEAYDRGEHEHFMLKEILEQPRGVRAHAQGPARPAVQHRPPRRPEPHRRATCSTSSASRSSAAARPTTRASAARI